MTSTPNSAQRRTMKPLISTRHSRRIADSLVPSRLWLRQQRFGLQLFSFIEPTMTSNFPRAHKEILFFASPFFEAALSGNWSETGRPLSMSSVVTISHSQPELIPTNHLSQISADSCLPSADPDTDPEDLEVLVEFDSSRRESENRDQISHASKSKERGDSLAKLQATGQSTAGSSASRASVSAKRSTTAQAVIQRHPKNGPDAVIVLKEEKVCLSP